MKGTCQRLTLPLHETQLIFEEQAKIVQDANPGSSLSGERVVWELVPMVEPQPTPQTVDPRHTICILSIRRALVSRTEYNSDCGRSCSFTTSAGRKRNR